MMDPKTKYLAMLDGYTLVDDDGNQAWFDQTEGFVALSSRGSISDGAALVLDDVPPWHIEPKDGWLPHYGGPKPEGNIDRVRLRGGDEKFVSPPPGRWAHYGIFYDIVAYHLAEPKMNKAEAKTYVRKWVDFYNKDKWVDFYANDGGKLQAAINVLMED